VTTPPYASDVVAEGTVDAVMVGGGAAGLNGALILTRSRRSVVVIESGFPRNAPIAAVLGRWFWWPVRVPQPTDAGRTPGTATDRTTV